ncbi:MAG: type I-B CRISPR-associated protein Cas7/Cst2/DevR [Caldimicrobium sp.]
MNKGLTLTVVFKAQSLNYGEGTGNISELKKLSRENGQLYTFVSRQALRYDIVRLGSLYFGWQLSPVDSSRGTIQFDPNATIRDYPELDLFGYMKTEEGKGSLTRSAVVRITSAISLEPYLKDVEFLSNKGLADRISANPNIAQIEQHLSYYSYSLTIDLDKVGIDDDIKLPKAERAKRIKDLLEIVKILNREIRGRTENLNPLFVIGGIYDVKNPFFHGRIKLEWRKNGVCIAISPIKDTLNITYNGKKVGDDTVIGYISGEWANEEEIKSLPVKKVSDIETIFTDLSKEIEGYYECVAD